MGKPLPAAAASFNEDMLLRDDRNGVALLTMNRPQVRNTLSEDMIDAIQAQIDDIAASAHIGAVVIAGTGSAFCAGHDLKQMSAHRADADGGRAYFTDILARCANMMQAITTCPKPVIAAVNGTATAAGCQLVASCDLAVASETARFCTPGVNIGLFCSSPMVALTRNIGRKRAMEMLLLGDMIGAEAALEFDLVNRVVAPDRLLPEALHMAEAIAAKPAATVAVGKRMFQRQLELPLSEAYHAATGAMVESMMHADAREGISAFIEKRTPDWNNG